jgi:SagB-type dehydrogenase family enzyme
MQLSTLPSSSALVAFWEETRLRNAVLPREQRRLGGYVSCDAMLLRRAISEMLDNGYGLRNEFIETKGRSLRRARTVPSAGALYPFQVFISVGSGRDDGRWSGTYCYDVDRCGLEKVASYEPDMFARLTGGALNSGKQFAAAVPLVVRPWESMEKYGPRGYLYALLDVSHAAVSIALAARAQGLSATINLRFDRWGLSQLLSLGEWCYEPQILVTIDLPYQRVDPCGESALTWHNEFTQSWPALTEQERWNWQSLRNITAALGDFVPDPAYGMTTSIADSVLPPDAAWAAESFSIAPRPLGDEALGIGFRQLARQRRSSKSFLETPLPLAKLKAVFSLLTSTLPIDFCDGPGSGVGLRLAISNVAGLSPGIYDYSSETSCFRGVVANGQAQQNSSDMLMAACMGQESVRNLSALVVIYAPLRGRLGSSGRSCLVETHFHAAHVAHKLCLGAAADGIGITCVGGFDDARCAALVGLPNGHDVVYVLAVGGAGEGGRKWDREAFPFAHETPSMEERSFPVPRVKLQSGPTSRSERKRSTS